MIKLYTANNCGACMTVQAILEGNGLTKGEHFQLTNIDEDKEAGEYIRSNYMGVPVTEYNDLTAVGVQMDTLNKMIEAVK